MKYLIRVRKIDITKHMTLSLRMNFSSKQMNAFHFGTVMVYYRNNATLSRYIVTICLLSRGSQVLPGFIA